MRFVGDDRLRTVAFPGARWLDHVGLWTPGDPDQLTTGDFETAVILLHGTFDLVGGGTAWPARGARTNECAGRPMAVFLPPKTPFRVGNGKGTILLMAARQPVVREATGRELLAQKPLLPLAGSGKSFDPTSGEWKPAETFPNAPESLPPRRFERIEVGGCVVERVFAPDYKAATLSVDEVVVPAGRTLAVRDIPRRPRADETMLFVRGANASVRSEGIDSAIGGDTAMVLRGAGDDTAITTTSAPAYCVFAYAGKGN